MSYVKREWTVENIWGCSSCGTNNQGRVKKCTRCGAPKDDSDIERMPGDTSFSNRVVDEKLNKQFAAGPDWVCGYCQHHETKLASKCSECGSKQGEKKKDVGAPQSEENKEEMREIIARGKRKSEEEDYQRSRKLALEEDQRRRAARAASVDISATDNSTVSNVNVSEGSATIRASGNSSVSNVTVGGTPAFAEEFADEILTKDRWWSKLVARLEAWHGARRAQTLKIGDLYRETTIDVPGSRPKYLSKIENFGRSTDQIPWKKIWYVLGSGIATGVVVLGVVCGLYYAFATRDANASVVETRWSYNVSLHQRRIDHGSDWRDSMHAHAFDVTCSREVRSHHRCDPYTCNPHSVGHDCRCRNVESCHQSCTSRRNGSSSCREVCSSSRSCSTCYSTEYDTCYRSCPDYDDHCEYQFPDWPEASHASLGGVDHSPVRPSLNAAGGQACVPDDEDLHLRGFDQCVIDELTFDVQFDAGETGHWAIRPSTRSEFDRYITGNQWHVQFNHAGMFHPVERSGRWQH